MSEQLKNDIVAKWKENLQKHLPELTTACSLDPFLSEIAQKNRSHRFMGGAAQTLYQRQVKFLAAILREQFGNKESLTVLDWGCGKGHITYLLKKAGLKVTSCDLPSAFEQKIPIIEKSNITAISLEDPIKIPFENSFFDCVVSFGVLEHVKNDLASMHEVHRILKPGGVFYITFLPYLLSWTQALARARGDTYHDRLYTKKKLHALAEKTKFEVVGMWHGQLAPKIVLPDLPLLEYLDRALCARTFLRYFATNLEAVLIAK